jgi:hypothetical protein
MANFPVPKGLTIDRINKHAIRKIDRKSRTVVLDVAGRITTLHYSADRYRILSWLFGGEKE